MKYDTTTPYKSWKSADDAMKKLRPLAVGDKVTINKITITISEIIYSDIFTEYNKETDSYVVYFMCEFKDSHRKYRYYKSFFDKGTVELIG